MDVSVSSLVAERERDGDEEEIFDLHQGERE